LRTAAAAAAALLLALVGAGAAHAAHPPVVLIVFDEFPTTSLLGKDGRHDALRYPGFAQLASSSTWFRNATTVHDSTFAAVPSILDGRLHRHREGATPRAPRHSLPSLLARHGYRVHASVEVRGVCPNRYCGHGRSRHYYLNRSRLPRLGSFIHAIRRTRLPTLHLKHTLLPHLPWVYLPSGHQYLRGPLAPLRGLSDPAASRNPTLVRLAWQRHLLQVGAVDHMIGRLIQRLVATRLWDRALVVVVADHGISFRVGELDRRAITRANLARVAPVPLFVKRPHQRRGRISRAYARTVDVTPTIASVLHVRIPWRTSGRSVFSCAVARRHTVRVGTRVKGKRALRLGARAFQARWRAVIHIQHALFGYGVHGLFGGPHARLLGRAVRAARRGKVRARIVSRPGLRVFPKSRVRPVMVAGHIVGGARGARRDIAVVMNGRVGAVSRTFHLPGTRGESFAALVPEISLRRGRNRVRVLSVTGRGGHLRLRLLGRA
jgi:hypothetical protein